jgi:hypothetical protein
LYPFSSISRTQWPAMKPDAPVTNTNGFEFDAAMILLLAAVSANT